MSEGMGMRNYLRRRSVRLLLVVTVLLAVGLTRVSMHASGGPQPAAAAASPAGSLAIITDNSIPGPGMYRLDLASRRLTRLTTRGTDSAPVWSRDGKRIAFVRPHYRLYIVNRDGSGLHQAGKLPVFSASWGRGDRELAVSTGKAIWIIAPNGSIHRRLYSPKDAAIYEVAWSPDGRTILFGNDAKGIFSIGARGGRARLIIRPPKSTRRHLFFLRAPAWAPNGRRFAYTQDNALAFLHGPVIRTANADGSARRTVASVGPEGKG